MKDNGLNSHFREIGGEVFKEIIREDSPAQIANQTGIILEILFTNKVANPDPAKFYLKNFTTPYIDQAKKGLDDYFTRRYPPIEKRRLQIPGIPPNADKNNQPNPESCEAIDHMASIFSHMHSVIKIPELPMGFSRRGILGYPIGREAFARRISELEIVVESLAEGNQSVNRSADFNVPLFRTYAFFQTASTLPDHMPTSLAVQKQEIEYLREGIEIPPNDEQLAQEAFERDTVNRLLNGINISF